MTQDGHWNTPFKARPDSVVGWFKYAPQTKDTLRIKVVLHRDYGKQPDADSWTTGLAWLHTIRPSIQEVSGTGFQLRFVYFDDEMPQYVLVVLNSGNRFDPVAGSIAYFDDIEMIYHSPQSKYG